MLSRHVALPEKLLKCAPAHLVLTTPASFHRMHQHCGRELTGSVGRCSMERCPVPPAIVEASEMLHVHHRVPFMASRVAASMALSSSLQRPVTFSGRRSDAHREYHLLLSLSHEANLAAAVAWRPGCAVYAVDIADVRHVHRLRNRFPQFDSRWLPGCATTSRLPPLAEASVQKSFDIAGTWWHSLLSSSGSAGPNAVMASCVAAQHWSVRECCVKLLGIPGRAFQYGSVDLTGVSTCSDCESVPSAYIPTEHVLQLRITGKEGAVFKEKGLQSSARLTSWVEWVAPYDEIPDPHVVTVVCCLMQDSACGASNSP